MDTLNSAMTFQNIVYLAVIYYATSVFFNFRAVDANWAEASQTFVNAGFDWRPDFTKYNHNA